jgi:hypothetical protein
MKVYTVEIGSPTSVLARYKGALAKVLLARREFDEATEDRLLCEMDKFWKQLTADEAREVKALSRDLARGFLPEAEFIREQGSTPSSMLKPQRLGVQYWLSSPSATVTANDRYHSQTTPAHAAQVKIRA